MRLLAVLGLALVGCQGADDVTSDLRIWVEPNGYVTGPIAIEGCKVLAPLGVVCQMAATRAEANTWIRVQETPVGGDFAGYGWTNGNVVIDGPAFYSSGGGVEGLLYAVAHELGHRVGMVDHVPACEEPHGTYCGSPVCGAALMNNGGPDRTALTDVDVAHYGQQLNQPCAP